MIFKINGTDFTDAVVRNSYAVNHVDEFDSWTDCNRKEHRSNFRSKVKGSLDLIFMTLDEYKVFADALKLRLTDGTSRVELSVNNSLEDVVCYCYISYAPKRGRTPTFDDYMEKFTVEVEER